MIRVFWPVLVLIIRAQVVVSCISDMHEPVGLSVAMLAVKNQQPAAHVLLWVADYRPF
jgi:hypothetical protein